MKEKIHNIGDLVYFKTRIDSGNAPESLGIIVKKDEGDNDLYHVMWTDGNDTTGMYSAQSISYFKRNLRLHLEGFE